MRNHDRSETQAQISISLPRDLLAIIDAAASADGRTRSNLIVHMLRREFGARMAAQEELGQEAAAAAPVYVARLQPESKAAPSPRAKAN